MTECNMCGNCCEDIYTSWNLPDLKNRADRWRAGPDPTISLVAFWDWIAPEWEAADLNLEDALTQRRSTLDNYDFISVHWSVQKELKNDEVIWDCAKFDPESRACTAHDDRPPICSGYPWYGRFPYREALLSAQCSFNADVRTMLPIVSVT